MQNKFINFSRSRTIQSWATPGVGNPSVSTTTISAGYDSVVASLPNPGNKKAPTGFSYTTILNRGWEGTWYVFDNQGRISSITTGALGGNSLWDAGIGVPDRRNYHYNKALDALNEKVRGTLDLSVSALEFRSTQQMIGSAHRLNTYVGDLLNRLPPGMRGLERKLKYLERFLQAAGSNWLRWQYGVKPLMNDLYQAAEKLQSEKIEELLTVNSKSLERMPSSVSVQPRYQNDRRTANLSGVQGCQFAMRFKQKKGFDPASWSSLNPVSMAYELLTLSFVIDWAYNVGSAVRSLETAVLYDTQFVSGYYTELWAMSGHMSGGTFRQNNGWINQEDGESRFEYKRFSRAPLGSYPLPRMPTFKVDLGSERMLSAASLLAQQLR